jgi:hypothetical protein
MISINPDKPWLVRSEDIFVGPTYILEISTGIRNVHSCRDCTIAIQS